MQYSWLEQLVKEGHVRPDVKDMIYSDCSRIMEKSAGGADFFKMLGDWPAAGGEHIRVQVAVPKPEMLNYTLQYKKHLYTRGEHAKRILSMAYDAVRAHPMLIATGVGAATIVGGLISAPFKSEAEAKKLIDLKVKILADPKTGKYKDKAGARFDELVHIAPAVARNEALAKRLVAERLHSGFTAQDIQSLALLQTQSTKDQEASGKARDSYISKTSAVAYSKTLADVIAMCEDAGVLEKNAAKGGGTWEATKKLIKGIGVLSGVSLVGSLAAGGVNYAKSLYDNKQFEKALQKSFSEAMKQSDPNREPLHANKDKAMMAFQTLAHFAPSMAIEPSAARAFMNTIVSSDQGTHISHVKDLAEVERNLQATKGANPFFEGMAVGADALGLSKTISTATSDLLSPVMYQGRRDISEALGVQMGKKELGLNDKKPTNDKKFISDQFADIRRRDMRTNRSRTKRENEQIQRANEMVARAIRAQGGTPPQSGIFAAKKKP